LKSYFEKHPELFQLPEQVRFRHILVKFEPSWQLEKKEIAHKKALKLRARLLNGEKFEKVAAEASDCPSRERGGDLGWFKRGQLAPFMERTLLNLKIDALSEPVDDHFGYHIIQVTDRRSARSVGYSEAKPKISEHLRQEQAVRKAREFAGTLRNRSKVEIFLPTSGTLGVR
jgi:peptidyl-prolyl cis-trans isomerase C